MQRNIALDVLKVVMALMVIGLHTSFFTDVSRDGAYLLIQGLFRVAVPVFFIINGYFFWAHREQPQHWCKRLITLYAVWMTLYSVFWGPEITSVSQLGSVLFFGYYHLWYLPATLVAALLVYQCRHRSVTFFTIATIVTFLSGVALQYGMSYELLPERVMTLLPDPGTLYRNGLFFGFPFFAMGVLIRRVKLHQRLSEEKVQFALLMGALALIAENTLNDTISHGTAGFDLLLSLDILCPALFVFALQRNWLSDTKELGDFSTALYFIHPALLMWLQDTTTLTATPLTLAVTVSSLLAAMVMMRLHRRLTFIL